MNRIEELRNNMNLNKAETARRLEIPYTTYISYEKGEREPNSEMLIKLAKFFNVSVDYLIGRITAYPEPEVTEDIVEFPVLGSIAAGYNELALEDWMGDTVQIPASFLRGHSREDYFVLQVKGDSMYPLYIAGDKVLVLKQSTVNASGDVAAVLYDDNCGTLKKVEYIENGIRLIPINAMYPPKEVTGADAEHCRIMGVPKLLIRDIK